MGAPPLKYEAVATLVRGMIADGTLLPGAAVPSAAELARRTGYAALTCRAALGKLLADGTLTPGVSPAARLRVPAAPGWRAALPLSSALAAYRRAAGLTQRELGDLVGASVTTVGHAETGRLWQSREFWRLADGATGAAGALLRLYDQCRAPGEEPPPPPPPPPPFPASVTITAAGVAVTWADGTQTLARPPGTA